MGVLRQIERLAVSRRYSALFEIEKTLDPIDAMFLYEVIELTGEIADMAERVGRRLELLLS